MKYDPQEDICVPAYYQWYRDYGGYCRGVRLLDIKQSWFDLCHVKVPPV